MAVHRACSCTLADNSAGIGGGAYDATLNNCTLTSNSARSDGGGASGGTLSDCIVAFNSASSGGGVAGATLKRCILAGNSATRGGGAGLRRGGDPGRPAISIPSRLNHCILKGNTASDGGGVCGGTLTNCLLTGNWATNHGGGAAGEPGGGVPPVWEVGGVVDGSGGAFAAETAAAIGTSIPVLVNNSTLVGNTAQSGGGVFEGAVKNSIIYFNNAATNANYHSCALKYCCTLPFPTNGAGNITNSPLFADYNSGNLRLRSASPCINVGNNAYVTQSKDLDGRPRMVGGTVDMGAYEYQGAGMSQFIGWLQQYGLPTDGSTDFTDSDGDGLNNRQEWRCRTDPTDALSVLRLLPPMPAGSTLNVSWQSVAGVSYFVERSKNLMGSPAFRVQATNLVGRAGTTTFTDTNAVGARPFFYRVGVVQEQ